MPLFDDAIAFALAHEIPWPRDPHADPARWGVHHEDPPPFNRLRGPVHPRGGVSGVIHLRGEEVAAWGEPERADQTFSVAKTYLALLAGLAHARGRLAPDERVSERLPGIGPYTAGVMSDNEQLVKRWMQTAECTGEDMWRLPLNNRLRDQLKSSVADMRNTGDRFGGAITAGLFLKTFAKDTPWVHVDIAGPASVSTARPSQPKGGTGFAVASIVEYATKH